MDVSNFCRLCGENTDNNSYSLFDKANNGQQLIQIIKKYIPILVYRTDPLSKRICSNCFEDLNKYFDFLHKCISVQEDFKTKLSDQNSSDENIQLFLNTLENHKTDYLQNFYISYCKNLPTKDFSSQLSDDDFIVSEPPSPEPPPSPVHLPIKRKFKILTPELINEGVPSPSTSPPLKKRKLAGPRCKTRPDLIFNPKSLLQCALHAINIEIDPNYDKPELKRSYGLNYSSNGWSNEHQIDRSVFNEALRLRELNFSKLMANINLEAPVDCNYCMKRFPNILELSKHEINHILVDAGPRCDSKKFKSRFRQFYNMYLRAQCENVVSENGIATLSDNYSDLYNSSLNSFISDQSAGSVFELRDEQIYVNGKPLLGIDKNDRKQYFKSIYVNGIKKKFCPICRHTFKDNWAIDWHYSNNSCQYTCKYCGLKFKYHKDLFPEHLKTHEGQPCNKIFGPSDKKGGKRKKIKIIKRSLYNDNPDQPRIQPIKLKALLEQKSVDATTLKVKEEPFDPDRPPGEILNNQGSSQYQAYFCRKCFKVFFKIDEFNFHTQICTGATPNDKETPPQAEGERSLRPARQKDFSFYNDSDSESFGSNLGQYSPSVSEENGPQSYECGVCSSSFPTRHSRNSHMRIHKSQKIPADKVTNYLQKNMSMNRQESVQKQVQNANLIRKLNSEIPPTPTGPNGTPLRFTTLNPVVAKLVQNNPQISIRSYTQANPDAEIPLGQSANSNQFWSFSPQALQANGDGQSPSVPPKLGYRCGDCGGRFENKSLLYYHKMNDCVVKRNYECAFCHKKFGSQDHYNIHMLHVHPE